MAFANFSVLAVGGLLMGIPILLHLMMKQRPRHQTFPALRFLRHRQIANKRQMQFRNWLLLAMRLLAIGLLAGLFARPSVDAVGMANWMKALVLVVLAPLAIVAFAYSWVQKKRKLLLASTGAISLLLCVGLSYFAYRAMTTGTSNNLGDAQAPVAAVLVFDTSPRMGLRHQNLTRLEEAQRVARELMRQLPVDSEVAVVDATSSGTFSVDIGTAVNMVDSLQVMGMERRLSDLVERGIDVVSERSDKRKEVYVLSELSSQVWEELAFRAVRSRLAEDNEISLFVLDVGVTEPRNFQLGQLQLSSDSLVKGQPLRIKTDVTSLRGDGQVDIEVALEEPDSTRPVVVDGELLLPKLTRHDRVTRSLAPGATAQVDFELRGIPLGVHHGQVRITSNDGLVVDDTRYFTIDVRPPFSVLLATSAGANPDYVHQSISPDEFVQRGTAVFDCHTIDAKDLTGQQLDDYSVVALLDPTPLTKDHWDRLSQFAQNGGSVVVFLGRNATPFSDFNAATASLMPGDLTSHWRTARDDFLFLSPRGTAHPMLTLFRGYETTTAWDESPIYKHWVLADLKAGANVVASYSNDEPAIIESVIGDGRVVVMTTPVSDRRNDTERPAWNHVPPGLPFFMLMNGLFPYLAGQSQQTWNYDVAQLVTVSTEESPALTRSAEATWQLVTPLGDWQNVRGIEGRLTIASTDVAGAYRLKPSDPHEPAFGFSSNLPNSATDIRRLDTKKLDTVLGEDRYTLARGTKELNRGIGRARVGRELFPFLMLVVVALLAMEHLLSNHFYSTTPAKQSAKELQSAA